LIFECTNRSYAGAIQLSTCSSCEVGVQRGNMHHKAQKFVKTVQKEDLEIQKVCLLLVLVLLVLLEMLSLVHQVPQFLLFELDITETKATIQLRINVYQKQLFCNLDKTFI
jgi:hypothetical protein